LFCLQ